MDHSEVIDASSIQLDLISISAVSNDFTDEEYDEDDVS